MAFFITVPMSFMVGDPISAITAFTPAIISASPAAFGKLFYRVFALLDEGIQYGVRFFFVERRHLFDLAMFERGFHHPQGGEALLLACLHGRGDILLNLFDQAHGGIIGQLVIRVTAQNRQFQ